MKRLLSIFGLLTLLLAGCSPSDQQGGGFFHTYFVEPFIQAIQFLAGLFHDNYGLAIIIITLGVRFILMPIMLRTYKNSQQMRVKMNTVKPEMTLVQDKMKKAKTPEEKQKAQAEMMELYRKHDINPMNMGCLPILIQMPIFMGVYYAIRSSEEIATHSFLWFDLGQSDIAMALIAGLLYFIQYRVTLIGIPEQQQKQMKVIGLLSPIMILIISFNAPSALPLYWQSEDCS
ncbi:membrane protein insertase YidC [Halobacillus sp. BAB-2008]|nr:membrane protein insertase YidC [Halobacillus sp. BAB-2008]